MLRQPGVDPVDLSHWLKIMKGDPKAIFIAASKASQAVDYLVGLQPKPAPDLAPPEGEGGTPVDGPSHDDTALNTRRRPRNPEAKR